MRVRARVFACVGVVMCVEGFGCVRPMVQANDPPTIALEPRGTDIQRPTCDYTIESFGDAFEIVLGVLLKVLLDLSSARVPGVHMRGGSDGLSRISRGRGRQ